MIRPAEMHVPETLARAAVIYPITDLGGGTRGSFQVAAHSGDFRRAESRLQFFDVLDFRAGSAAFSLTGPLVEGSIEAACKMRERLLNLGNFTVTAKPMAYGCEFTINGRAMPARFEIQEVRQGLAGAMMKTERRGEIALDRVILQIQSIHQLAGSPLQVSTPIGYAFLLDGIEIGAIELNGTPRLWLAPGEDIPLQRAIITAAIALAVFWDPADSLL